MKKKVGELFGKPVIQGDKNLWEKDKEYYLKQDSAGDISLYGDSIRKYGSGNAVVPELEETHWIDALGITGNEKCWKHLIDLMKEYLRQYSEGIIGPESLTSNITYTNENGEEVTEYLKVMPKLKEFETQVSRLYLLINSNNEHPEEAFEIIPDGVLYFPKLENAGYMFVGLNVKEGGYCGKLYAPNLTNTYHMFINAKVIPEFEVPCYKVTSLNSTFRYIEIQKFGNIHEMFPNAEIFEYTFASSKLEEIGDILCPIKKWRSVVFGCHSLKKVGKVDVSKCTYFYRILDTERNTIETITFVGLGTMPEVTNISFIWTESYASVCNWGKGDDPESLQSVKDTFGVYLFDRAAAGYEPCTLELMNDTYNLLSEEELTEITNKGYIVTHS